MTVLVVGAGPTGLTLACALAQRGVAVRVVDAAPGPATTSRALALMPRGAEVLARVGVADLTGRAVPALRTTVHAGGKPILTLRFAQDDGQPVPLFLPQTVVEGALRARFADLGGRIQWNTPVTGVDAESDGAAVRFGAATGRADWVVGCDGAHSAVRKAAGIAFPGAAAPERFLLADVHAALPLERDGRAGVWLRRDGMFAAFPLPGADVWRLMADVPDGSDDDVLGELARLLRTRAGVADARIGAAEWTSAFRIHRRIAAAYRAGRLLLAGDAAHVHSPFGGQGMNTGIGDAENLAWKLALVQKGMAGHRLLDSYEAERRPVAREVVANTTAGTRILLGGNPVARLVRDRVLLPVLNRRRVQRLGAAGASQLAVTYWGGPLAPNVEARLTTRIAGRVPRVRGVGELRAGDRVPSIPCRLPDGAAGTLHAALGGRWALVVPTGEPAPEIDYLGGELVVLRAEVPSVLLVRPDAHVAWQERDAALGVNVWLDNVLGSGSVERDSLVPLTDPVRTA